MTEFKRNLVFQIPEMLQTHFPRPFAIFNITSADQRLENKLAYQISYQKSICLHIVITLYESKTYIKNIYLKKLDKCFISGSNLLQMLENFAADFDIVIPILLTDESFITLYEKNISLKYLSLLKSGKSWYNTLGYVSADYETEQAHNQAIINMPFMTAVPYVIEDLANGDYREMYNAFMENMMFPETIPCIDTIKDRLGLLEIHDVDTVSVKTVFTRMHAILKSHTDSNCINKELVTFIYAMVMAFRYGSIRSNFTILYDNHLIKSIESKNQ